VNFKDATMHLIILRKFLIPKIVVTPKKAKL